MFIHIYIYIYVCIYMYIYVCVCIVSVCVFHPFFLPFFISSVPSSFITNQPLIPSSFYLLFPSLLSSPLLFSSLGSPPLIFSPYLYRTQGTSAVLSLHSTYFCLRKSQVSRGNVRKESRKTTGKRVSSLPPSRDSDGFVTPPRSVLCRRLRKQRDIGKSWLEVTEPHP